MKEATPSTAFGKRLRRLRKARGLSAIELAGMLGVSRAIVSAWEVRGVLPRQDSLAQLALILGVHPRYLVSGRAVHDSLQTDEAVAILAAARREIAELLGVPEDAVQLGAWLAGACDTSRGKGAALQSG